MIRSKSTSFSISSQPPFFTPSTGFLKVTYSDFLTEGVQRIAKAITQVREKRDHGKNSFFLFYLVSQMILFPHYTEGSGRPLSLEDVRS